MTLRAVVVPSTPSVTPSQGLVPFGQMKSDIATYYGMDKDPEKVEFVGRIIHDIVDDLNSKKLWRFNLIKAADFNTATGTDTYTVPTDLWKIYNIRKTSDVDYTISGTTEANLDSVFQSQRGITGYPYIRADFNIFRDGSIKLFPIPDGAYTITLRYFSLITKPTSDTGYLDVPPPFQNVFKYGALARLGALVERPIVQYWESKYQEAYGDANKMDEFTDDEHLRFINSDEAYGRWSYINPAARPRYLDWY